MEITKIRRLSAEIINPQMHVAEKGEFKHCGSIGEVQACCGYLM